MSRTAKVMAVLVGAAIVVVLSAGMVVASSAVASGIMTVSIHEAGPDGLDLYVPVPAGLVEATLSLAPVVLRLVDDDHLDHELSRFREELDYALPAIEAVLEHLEEMPDAVLVEVESDFESVRVSKQGRSIHILVEEGGDRIQISVPTRVFRSVGDFLIG